MGGATQYLHFIPDYFEKIGDQKIKEDVIKIITKLAEDFENLASSRAVYLLGELPIPNKQRKVLDIIQRLDPILETIIGANEVPETCMKYLDYICEINKLIGKLKIVEAKPFLEKQAKYALRRMPSSVTNEYYAYHLSGKSAEASLSLL